MAQQFSKTSVLYRNGFDGRGFTDENSLAAARLTQPDNINQVLTYLQGKDSDRFPLTFLTEGQKGGTQPIEVSDIQYTWDIMGKSDKAVAIVASSYISTSKAGINGTEIQVTFAEKWFNHQHTIVSPNGVQCRISDYPVKVANGWSYKFTLNTNDTTDYVSYLDLQPGVKWAMEGPGTVSESLSFGNESNIVTPGKAKNQVSILRKSFHYGGNVANRYVECQFRVGNTTTSRWMDYEEWTNELKWKELCENHYWWSIYNRDVNGKILAVDNETGQPIPVGGGVVQQIPHKDTYSTLTAKKLDSTVLDVMYGRTDDDMPREIVLYTGIGGAREFDRAIKAEVAGISQITGDKFVRGSGANLIYGGYFKAYETNEGNTIIIKPLRLLDHGARALNSPKHPVTGLPMSSYNMFFIDQSTYDGVPNVRMVTQKGRGMIRGLEQGMSLVKGASYGDYSGNSLLKLATSQDKTSIHYLASKGIVINRNSHCFWLEPDMSIGI